MDNIRFLDDNGTFTLDDPENVSGLYFPLAGAAGAGGTCGRTACPCC